MTSQDQDLWAQAEARCAQLAQGIVDGTRWMKMLPPDVTDPNREMDWSAARGLRVNDHYRKPTGIRHCQPKVQLLAAANLPALFELIEREVREKRTQMAVDAELLEKTRQVLTDVLKA